MKKRTSRFSSAHACRSIGLNAVTFQTAAYHAIMAMIAWYAAVWIVTAFNPIDRHAWALENLLVLFFIAALAFTYRRFAFSNLSYLFLTIFLTLHAIGAHFTYQ